MKHLIAALEKRARDNPDGIALRHARFSSTVMETTWRQLWEAAGAWAGAMRVIAPEGAIVPMYLSKGASCVAAMLGAAGSGRPFAVLNRKLRYPQVADVVRRCGASAALIDPPGLLSLRGGLLADERLRKTRWWVVQEAGASAAPPGLVDELRAAGLQVQPVEEILSQAGQLHPDLPGSRAACCLFTSGSTGTPKGVLISADDLEHRAAAEARCLRLTPDDVLLSLMPFSFVKGLNHLFTAMVVGCPMVLLDSFFPAEILSAVERSGITGISAVPAIWQSMLAGGFRFDTAGAHRSLRFITMSGGDLSPRQLQQLSTLAPGAGLFKFYAQTEAFRTTVLRPEEFSDRPTSVGRALEGVRVYVVRPDGSRCDPGEIGEVVHAGAGMMLGYLDGQDPQHKRRPNPFFGKDDPSPVAIFTGDNGYLDEAGYLFLKGRQDTMLKIAGNRVYPEEIATQILQVPGVAEACVGGLAGADEQMHPVAFVVLDKNGPTAGQLLRILRERLPSYMVPREVLDLPSIPRTATNKPDMPALLELARRNSAATPLAGS